MGFLIDGKQIGEYFYKESGQFQDGILVLYKWFKEWFLDKYYDNGRVRLRYSKKWIELWNIYMVS